MTWSVEQVEAIAPNPAAMSAAKPLATPAAWSGAGSDDQVLWGSYAGSGAEPYDTMVDHVGVGFACTCPSRRRPCKHALALLLLWIDGHVAPGAAPEAAASWIARRRARTASMPTAQPAAPDDASPHSDAPSGPGRGDGGARGDGEAETAQDPDPPDSSPPPDGGRDERVERMYEGLTELDRWLEDRMRTGLADPALARYTTWDDLAARLVDAQAGSLANRIRRLAGLVGAAPDWHEHVLAEFGLLHLLTQAGRRLGTLPAPLADAVATSVGWQVRKADVLAGVPDTDDWVVAGRSDRREDRVEVRRIWLRAKSTGRWALVLSFAAYQQSLEHTFEVGTAFRGDLHRYPGPALRALIGRIHPPEHAALFPNESFDATWADRPPSVSIADACDEIGAMLIAEPWLDRVPATVRATPSSVQDRWVLTDATGSLPIAADAVNDRSDTMPTLLALSQGAEVDITIEWTPTGVIPLAVHLADRAVDVGPRADPAFVATP